MRFTSSVGIFLLALFLVALPVPSHAQIGVGISIRIAPPALPVYTQPPCPGDGYLWTPGYWGYGPEGYYWVPGTWVRPPQVGVLWTPGYWGWGDGVYAWHAGYWGPHIGFYGGVNYGFGYVGVGYLGGEWRGGAFRYNTAVNHINVTVVHNTYRTEVNNTVVNRVSYNGGAGGINARPRPEEESAGREQHFGATGEQTSHEHAASSNRAQLASMNHGQPGVAATGRAGEFSGKDVVAAHGGGGGAGAAGNRGPASGAGEAGGNRPAYRPPNAGGGNAGGDTRTLANNAPRGNSAPPNAGGGNARTAESNAPRGGGAPPNRNAGGGGEARANNQPAHQNAAPSNAPKGES
jgi:hypothetical protein